MRNLISELLFITVTMAILSCGWNPNFEVEGNCLITHGDKWFGDFRVEIEETGHSYRIVRNYDLDGSNKVCLDALPKAYSVQSYSDTKAKKSLIFIEGQTIRICRSGGDRAGICKTFVFKDGKLSLKDRQ